jgi:UDP-N-acetylmuramoyl-L-alanyl-D-glutamate-L-lysine ligase
MAEHPTFEDYFYCKRQILSRGKTLVINKETAHFDCVFEHAKSLGKPVVLFEAKDGAGYNPGIPGNFNVSNAAAARSACLLAGASEGDCRRGIEETQVPGRMEHFQRKSGGMVYVDYAHNGESLEQVMRFVKSTQKSPKSRLAVVLGATGNKGQSRRLDFARVLDTLGDLVVLTADDPDREDPEAIMAEITGAMQNSAVTVYREVDRVGAIRWALALTPGPEDAVLVAGKGTDTFQRIKGELTPYAGDVAVVRRLIAEEV